jgi:ribosomal protein L32
LDSNGEKKIAFIYLLDINLSLVHPTFISDLLTMPSIMHCSESGSQKTSAHLAKGCGAVKIEQKIKLFESRGSLPSPFVYMVFCPFTSRRFQANVPSSAGAVGVCIRRFDHGTRELCMQRPAFLLRTHTGLSAQ